MVLHRQLFNAEDKPKITLLRENVNSPAAGIFRQEGYSALHALYSASSIPRVTTLLFPP